MNVRQGEGSFWLCRRRLSMRRSVFRLCFMIVGVVHAPIFEVDIWLTPTRHQCCSSHQRESDC